VTFVASTYDKIAPNFDRQRALPREVALSVRAAVLAALGHTPVPQILDLGAGSGRIGQVFVTAGDDYVGVDLAAGMLQIFAGKETGGRRAVLIQADGRTLPFTDDSFDAVLLVAVFGDLPDWHPLIAEARRVLRPDGVVVIGRTATPDDGIDERLKQRLDLLLDKRMPRAPRKNGRKKAAQYLAEIASDMTDLVPANWPVQRSVRQFFGTPFERRSVLAVAIDRARGSAGRAGRMGNRAVWLARCPVYRNPSFRNAGFPVW
jgi:ubiquinone/menaquinone biosynthesis C-methylase UbiE